MMNFVKRSHNQPSHAIMQSKLFHTPTRAEKIGYSFGNLGKSVVWSSIEFFFLFYLTEIWNLSPVEAGLVIMLPLIWDALSDPLIGFCVDRTRSKLGRYGSYLLIGAPLCALSFMLLFNTKIALESNAFLYVLGASLLFRTCYTLCDVPHNALMTRMSVEKEDALFISGARFFFSSVGALVVSVASVGVWNPAEAPKESGGVWGFACSAGIIYIVAIYVSVLSTRRVDEFGSTRVQHLPVGDAFQLVLKNQKLLFLLLLTLFQVATIPVFSKLVTYYGKFALDDVEWANFALAIITLSQAVSLPFWGWFAKQKGKQKTFILAHLNLIVFLVAFVIFPQFCNVYLFFIGASIGGLNMLLWACLPDAIQQGNDIKGQRVEALPTSLFLLLIKSSIGISAMLSGQALSIAGYAPDHAIDGFSDKIGLIMCGIPIAGSILCMMLLALVWRDDRV